MSSSVLSHIDRVDLIKRIQSFQELKLNWNGNACNPIGKEAIAVACTIVSELKCALPEAFPLADGGVQLEWDILNKKTDAKLYVELDVYARDDISFWCDDFLTFEKCSKVYKRIMQRKTKDKDDIITFSMTKEDITDINDLIEELENSPSMEY